MTPPLPEPGDRASAFADMCEAIERGDLATAKSLAHDYRIPLEQVWAPEDDFLDPRSDSHSPSP